jgi:hypothetical protein
VKAPSLAPLLPVLEFPRLYTPAEYDAVGPAAVVGVLPDADEADMGDADLFDLDALPSSAAPVCGPDDDDDSDLDDADKTDTWVETKL